MDTLMQELSVYNPWWTSREVLAEDPTRMRRAVYEELRIKALERELITAVVGLRRVGKTVTVKQVINELLLSGFSRERILYVSFDEGGARPLEEIIAWQLGRAGTREKLYFFLDEIQFVPRWNAILKKYVDLYPKIKFVVTGSASLFVGTAARESLAGRIQETPLFPWSFAEYLTLSGESRSEASFAQYLTAGEFPYLIHLPAIAEQREYVYEFIVKKVVERDLPRLKPYYGTELITLTDVLLKGSGSLVELNNMSTDLGIAVKTLREYLRTLEQTYLITQVFNAGSGLRTRSLRQRKIYAQSVNSVSFAAGQVTPGQLIETYVANLLLRRREGEVFFWRQRQQEVDFVWKRPEGPVPIEVKYQNTLRQSDFRSLLALCRRTGTKTAWVVCKHATPTREIGGIRINFVPAHELDESGIAVS